MRPHDIFRVNNIFATSKRPKWESLPVDIVDGQQRITTLSIFLVSLVQKLSMEKDQLGSVKGLTPEEIGFLENQIDNIITDFTKFLFRDQKTIAKRAFVQLPRLIRWSDKLGKDQRTSEFKSPVTTVTNELALLDDYGKYEFPDKVSNTEEGKLIHEVYDGFRELIEIISDEVKLKEKENEFVELKELKREQYRNLLNIAHDDVIDSVIDKATKIVELQDLVRLVYFSNFIIHRCTFAMVTASDPSSAFDIYEALNTTGVPDCN